MGSGGSGPKLVHTKNSGRGTPVGNHPFSASLTLSRLSEQVESSKVCWHKYCYITTCYCVAILINLEMRDGIFSFYIRSEEMAIRAIALVEKDSIRGFNKSHIYSVERLESSLNRLRKDRNTNWRVKATAYTHQGVSMRGFPARLEGEEGEEQFWFEGGSDADKRVRVEIQGAWLQNLPWQRAA
jgi:hypothetical protein